MEELKQGTVIRGIGSFYTVREENGPLRTLRAQKKIRREKISPLPGDEVRFRPGSGEEEGWIEEILPRRTLCLRPPAANVETLIVVISPVPEPDFVLVDRQIIRAVAQGMRVLLAVNKCDLNPSLAESASNLIKI